MLVPFVYTGDSDASFKLRDYCGLAVRVLLEKGIPISKSGSEGGYFSRFTVGVKFPTLLTLVAVGSFPADKNGRYMYNSVEKPIRLHANHLLRPHLTSRESADADKQEYPGAILYISNDKMFRNIYSFSGLEPQYDEFLSVLGGCFDDYHDSRLAIRSEREYLKLKDVVSLYKERRFLITTSLDEHRVMLEVAEEVVRREIATVLK